MGAGHIDRVAKEVLATVPKIADEGRRNELTNQLTFRLRWMAKRIEREAVLQVTARVPIDEDPELSTEGLPPARQRVGDDKLKREIIKLATQVNQNTNALLDMRVNPDVSVFGEISHEQVAPANVADTPAK